MDLAYLFVAVMLLVDSVVMGFCKYYKDPGRPGIYKRYGDGTMVTIVAVLSVAVAIMVAIKDGQNILKLFGVDEYSASIMPHLGAIALAVLVAAAYGVLLIFIAKKVSVWRKRWLRSHHRKREE